MPAPHFHFESKLAETHTFIETSQEAPQQGSDPESSICSLPLSAPFCSALCSQILFLVFVQQHGS